MYQTATILAVAVFYAKFSCNALVRPSFGVFIMSHFPPYGLDGEASAQSSVMIVMSPYRKCAKKGFLGLAVMETPRSDCMCAGSLKAGYGHSLLHRKQ